MPRARIIRPTKHYDESIKETDELLCDLISRRRQLSSDPGYPPEELLASWAGKYDVSLKLLRSLFGTLRNERYFKPIVKPEGFSKNLMLNKYVVAGGKLYAIPFIRQYANASVICLNVDWNYNGEDYQIRATAAAVVMKPVICQYELLFKDGPYSSSIETGTGGRLHFDFIVTPPLPDDVSGLELILRELEPSYGRQTGCDIVLRL